MLVYLSLRMSLPSFLYKLWAQVRAVSWMYSFFANVETLEAIRFIVYASSPYILSCWGDLILYGKQQTSRLLWVLHLSAAVSDSPSLSPLCSDVPIICQAEPYLAAIVLWRSVVHISFLCFLIPAVFLYFLHSYLLVYLTQKLNCFGFGHLSKLFLLIFLHLCIWYFCHHILDIYNTF